MNNKSLIIGRGEIGLGIYRLFPNLFDIVSHQEFKNVAVNEYSTIINCTFDPAYYSPLFSELNGFDTQLTTYLSKVFTGSVIYLSTRMIFGEFILNQDEYCDYNNNIKSLYGKNKQFVEKFLKLKLAGRFSCLRLPNVFSENTSPERFFGMMRKSHKEKNLIHFNFDIDSFREFISVSQLSTVVTKIINNGPCGFLNIGLKNKITIRHFIEVYQKYFGTCKVNYDLTPCPESFTFNCDKLNTLIPETEQFSIDIEVKKIKDQV